MPHTIVTNTCEGVGDCETACPVDCISQGPGKNKKGTDWYWINFDTCIDCGICLEVCPVKGAIIPEENPDLQRDPNAKPQGVGLFGGLKNMLGKKSG